LLLRSSQNAEGSLKSSFHRSSEALKEEEEEEDEEEEGEGEGEGEEDMSELEDKEKREEGKWIDFCSCFFY
jgi:hypothetical protein